MVAGLREYGQIQCAFWQSRTCKTLSDSGRLLAAYLLSGPHSNGIGCYFLPDGYVMGDLRWPAEKVTESFAELAADGFAYRFDEVVYVPEFIRWNGFRNENVAKARMEEFRAVPPGAAKQRVAAEILRWGKHLIPQHVADLKQFEQLPNESEIVCRTISEQNPTQPNPNPTQPTPGAHATDVPRETLSDDFGDFVLDIYPTTSHRQDWPTAMHSAQALIGMGRVTEAVLRRRVQGFRAFVDSGGLSDPSKVPAPQRWFALHQQGEAYWSKEWAAVPRKGVRSAADLVAFRPDAAVGES